MFTGLSDTGTYLTQIVGWTSGATEGVYSVLSNPLYMGITLVILVLILVPGTEH